MAMLSFAVRPDATEEVMRITRIMWEADDQSACIVRFSEGTSGKAQSPASCFIVGSVYRLRGKWLPSVPKYSDTFQIDSYTLESHGGQEGVVGYLEKHGEIGKGLAYRLWLRGGTEVIEQIRNTPSKFVEDKLFSTIEDAEECSKKLRNKYLWESTLTTLYSLLKGRGFHSTIYQALLDKWGVKAPAIISGDPFKMLGMPGAGFIRCDKMWKDLGLSHSRIKRQVWCLINEFRTDRSGHTWMSLEAMESKLREIFGNHAKPARTFAAAQKVGLLAYYTDRRPDGSVDRTWVTPTDRLADERAIALGIRKLNSQPSKWPTQLPTSTSEADRLPSEHQGSMWNLAAQTPVACLIGGPGTGKTHTLAYVIKEILSRRGDARILVAAPTGKAAVRATQSLAASGLNLEPAQTIHSLLQINRNGHDGGGWGFAHNEHYPLDVDYLIVDESSMIDTSLMASLIRACPIGAQVLFVGDPFQLPPVGHGAPLRDIIEAGISTGELTEVRRNAGRIVRTCHAIKAMKPMVWSKRINLEDGENLMFVEVPPTDQLTTIMEILGARVKGFDPVWETQVIVALNDKGNCARETLNKKCQDALNPDGYRVGEKGKYRVGDKVICTRNTSVLKVQAIATSAETRTYSNDADDYQPLGSKEEQYVANGEIGRVVAVNKRYIIIQFGVSTNAVVPGIPLVRFNVDDPIDLAYAVTCHKMQGSETPVAIIAVDEAAGRVADRSWHYTAISRASKICVVVGSETTIKRQVAQAKLERRKTLLVQMLRQQFRRRDVGLSAKARERIDLGTDELAVTSEASK